MDVSGAARPGVDRTWLAGRVLRHGAIVAGAIADGRRFTAGPELVLRATQVFLRMPDSIGPCPRTLERVCASGQIATYRRTEERCLVFDGCVQPAMCAGPGVTCDAGYTKASWAAGAGGCPAFACDPEFTAP